MRGFIEELRYRNVFRVAIAYVIAGWLVAQVADLSADAFNAPDWVMKMLIVVLLIGLPVALFLAWAYELTPEGVKKAIQALSGSARRAALTVVKVTSEDADASNNPRVERIDHQANDLLVKQLDQECDTRAGRAVMEDHLGVRSKPMTREQPSHQRPDDDVHTAARTCQIVQR